MLTRVWSPVLRHHWRPFVIHPRRNLCVSPSSTQSDPPSAGSNSTSEDILTDSFGRHHNYLRVSLTERCNLRCTYCMPADGVDLTPKSRLLAPNEFTQLISLFVSEGIDKIRFTGGEPMVHPQCVDIIQEVGQMKDAGLKSIGMTTNGLLLSKRLPALLDAGLNAVNISLDTLDPLLFPMLTRMQGHHRVIKAIEDAEASLPSGGVKVNCVIIRGVNDTEIIDFVRMTEESDIEVRFIEYMPFDDNRWENRKMVSYFEMLDRIRQVFPEFQRQEHHFNDTSKVWKVPGFKGRVGFISSMTEHFCGGCNRLRLLADGNLKVCLFGASEISLRDLLRENADDSVIRQSIRAAVQSKKFKHDGLDLDELSKQRNRPMIKIGG